jgi:putative SOS response-associated peptidase YedK
VAIIEVELKERFSRRIAKEWLRTCVIITGESNELVSQIHNRMPVILPWKHMMLGFRERREKKSCDRSLLKK